MELIKGEVYSDWMEGVFNTTEDLLDGFSFISNTELLVAFYITLERLKDRLDDDDYTDPLDLSYVIEKDYKKWKQNFDKNPISGKHWLDLLEKRNERYVELGLIFNNKINANSTK